MTREFIMMPEFDKQWILLGFSDKDLKSLQEQLLLNTHAGSVIQGTSGLRKLRFALDGKGKSGGVRIAYADFVIYEKIYLITVYSKNSKENLTKEERNHIKKLVEILEHTLAEGVRKR